MSHPCPHHCPSPRGGGPGALGVLAVLVVIVAVAAGPVVRAVVGVLEIAVAVTGGLLVIGGCAAVLVWRHRRRARRIPAGAAFLIELSGRLTPRGCGIGACPNKALPGESFCAECQAAIYGRVDMPALPRGDVPTHSRIDVDTHAVTSRAIRLRRSRRDGRWS